MHSNCVTTSQQHALWQGAHQHGQRLQDMVCQVITCSSLSIGKLMHTLQAMHHCFAHAHTACLYLHPFCMHTACLSPSLKMSPVNVLSQALLSAATTFGIASKNKYIVFYSKQLSCALSVATTLIFACSYMHQLTTSFQSARTALYNKRAVPFGVRPYLGVNFGRSPAGSYHKAQM